MIKTALLTALLGVAVAYAAPRPETSTYVDGNVASLKPNTGGTLVFSDDKAMTFRTWQTDVAVPYSSISKAELGAIETHKHDDPAFKVWLLPKRLHNTETQLLTVHFKNGQGDEQMMTLELAKASAPDVLATIERHSSNLDQTSSLDKTAKSDERHSSKLEKTAKSDPKKADSGWWGDDYWKTTRNASQWDAKADTTGK